MHGDNFSYYVEKGFGLLSPNQALVVSLFVGHHDAVTIDEAIATLKKDLVEVDPLKLSVAMDYFVNQGCLLKDVDGRYFKG